MENATTKTSSRKGKNLKFDQEWKDAVDCLPKHYRDEICAAIEAYQRDLTVIEVTPGVPRAIFMLIMPTIRRRYRARELRRLARARKAATKSAAKFTPSRRPTKSKTSLADSIQEIDKLESDIMMHPAMNPLKYGSNRKSGRNRLNSFVRNRFRYKK